MGLAGPRRSRILIEKKFLSPPERLHPSTTTDESALNLALLAYLKSHQINHREMDRNQSLHPTNVLWPPTALQNYHRGLTRDPLGKSKNQHSF